MKLKIAIEDGRSISVMLDDNPAARDFATLLPLTLTLNDYASTEKISDLPKRLSTESAPDGFVPLAGDVAYYAPWGNLAIYYRDFPYSPGLIKLGRLDGDLAALQQAGSIAVTIERDAPPTADRTHP